jgi:DNA-binding transcriptional LysR family regulator
MPDLVPLLHQRAPHVRLHCHQVERRDIAGELAAGTLDFAVDIPGLGKARLLSRKLHQDRYVCILRRDHPMARGRLTLKRYLDMEHVMVSSRRHGRSYTELALARSGEQVNTVLRLQHYQPAFHVVLGSDLALAAPRSLAAWYDVVVRELPFEVAPLDSLLYWHRNADHDPASIWMRDLMAEASRQRPDRAAA